MTPWGQIYCFSRGVISALVFAGLYHYGLITSYLLVYALACGTGAEIVLRSKLYIKQSRGKSGRGEDFLWGPLNLVQWYQNLALDSASESLAERRNRFLEGYLPKNKSFDELRSLALKNLGSFPDQRVRDEIRDSIEGLRKKLETEIQEKRDNEEDLKQRYRYEIGFMILDKVGKRGFKTQLSQ